MARLSYWRRWVAAATLAISVVAWIYRFYIEHLYWPHLAFYVLVPLAAWASLAGPLAMTAAPQQWVRGLGAALLIPTTLIWGLSIYIGIFGLRIH